MSKYLRINTPAFEFLENSENGDCYVKDKERRKYFHKPGCYASKSPSLAPFVEKISFPVALDLVYIALTVASVGLIGYLLAKSGEIFSGSAYHSIANYLFMLLFLLFNLAVHELCHYAALKLYGREIGKIGFKMNFIFPSLYVNTSDSYMLPRIRRFFVYYSGIMSNIFLSSIVVCFFPSRAFLACPVIWAVFANLCPVSAVRTDGYHILFNIVLNVVEYKGAKYKVFQALQIVFVAAIVLLAGFSVLQFFGIM